MLSLGIRQRCSCSLIKNASDTLLQVVQDRCRTTKDHAQDLMLLHPNAAPFGHHPVRGRQKEGRRLRASHSSLASASIQTLRFIFHASLARQTHDAEKHDPAAGHLMPFDGFLASLSLSPSFIFWRTNSNMSCRVYTDLNTKVSAADGSRKRCRTLPMSPSDREFLQQ